MEQISLYNVLLRWRLLYNVLFTASSLNEKHASSLYQQ